MNLIPIYPCFYFFQDEVWPFDFQKALAAKAKRGSKIEKMDSERALLGFLLAKIGKIDPDIVLGHDITGFDIDVLLHRTGMDWSEFDLSDD